MWIAQTAAAVGLGELERPALTAKVQVEWPRYARPANQRHDRGSLVGIIFDVRTMLTAGGSTLHETLAEARRKLYDSGLPAHIR